MSITSIPSGLIPGYPRLVSDLFEGKLRLDYGFQTEINSSFWRQKSKEESLVSRPTKAISECFQNQVKDLAHAEIIIENIKALETPGTLAVVTGQQVGLGGGPMLSLYKALSAIAIAQKMQEDTGIRTVPVFWMATSDHNLIETAQIHWIDQENRLKSFNMDSQENRSPVGNLQLTEQSLEWIDFLEEDLPTSDYKAETMKMIKKAYFPGNTFGKAFQIIGSEILGKYGMVFIDPDDPKLKQICQPFWKNAISEIDERMEMLQERSTEISQAGYKIQAPALRGRPALFYLDNNFRRKVVLKGHAKRALSDLIVSVEDLKVIAENEPKNLSAGVTLRPLYQAYLLPTAAYVAGPHEIAYWAQLPKAFSPLDLYKPAILPRSSFTLIEKKNRRHLIKNNIHPQDFFGNLQTITETVLKSRENDKISSTFEQVRQNLEDNFKDLNNLINGVYLGLENNLETAKNKISYQVDNLEKKFNHRLHKRNSDTVRTLERLYSHLRPARKLQERVLSPHYYFSRYSYKLTDYLLSHAYSNNTMHHFLDLEDFNN